MDINIEAYKQARLLTTTSNRFITHFSENGWGSSIFLIEKTGAAFARMYWYNDECTIFYLDWLNVDENRRQQGLGTSLQEVREELAKKLGGKTTFLWVHKNTWMHEWYKRRGYVDYQDYSEEGDAIWMVKTL